MSIGPLPAAGDTGVTESLEFDSDQGKEPDMIHVSGNIYAIAYQGDTGNKDEGVLITVEIGANGQITDPPIERWVFDSVKGKNPCIVHVSGDYFAIA